MLYLQFIIVVVFFLSQISLGFCAKPKPILFKIHSILPAGPYDTNFKDIYNCDPNTNYKLQYNLYLNKKSNNSMEIKGNITFDVQFDDTMFLEINMAMKDPVNVWKENVYLHKIPNACSSLKLIMGNEWNTFNDGLGIANQNCPTPAGTYIGPGLDTFIFMNTNLPKTFIYGTYKLRIYFSRKNEIMGCVIFVIEINRI